MKTNKIIAVAAVLALLAGSCTEDNLRIRLLSEPMSFGAKVLMDPTDINAAEWVEGEYINLNGTPRQIAKHDGSYYIDLDAPISGALTAVYPATTNANGNVVTYDAGVLTIHNLNIDFRGNKHRIIFPMAAEEPDGSELLKFDHLTAGLKLTLTATQDYTLGSLRIITYGSGSTSENLDAIPGINVQWAEQGLAVPGGMVGENGNSVDAKYASQMDFTITNNGEGGKVINSGNSISFCVPITVKTVSAIQVMGFDTDGKQVFGKMKTNPSAATEMEANHMYLVPTIEF